MGEVINFLSREVMPQEPPTEVVKFAKFLLANESKVKYLMAAVALQDVEGSVVGYMTAMNTQEYGPLVDLFNTLNDSVEEIFLRAEETTPT